MEVKLEFLDSDSTIMQCKYNNHNWYYKEMKKLSRTCHRPLQIQQPLLQGDKKFCRTCHRPMPYHHAGCKDKTKRERKDKKRKIKDMYTNFYSTTETQSCKYRR